MRCSGISVGTPDRLSALACTYTSAPPDSGTTNPKPFCSLKNLTWPSPIGPELSRGPRCGLGPPPPPPPPPPNPPPPNPPPREGCDSAVERSTLCTFVTCIPRWPFATSQNTVAPCGSSADGRLASADA